MNANIIEVIGPPGVGKSTLYNSLCSSWTPTSKWIPQDELLALPKPSFAELPDWLVYNLKGMLGKPKAKSLAVDYGLRFTDKHSALANFCWQHLTNSCMPLNQEIGNRFRSSYFLFNDFCRYQAILEKVNGIPCLVEEGFLQKSFLLHDNEAAIQDILQNYLELIPLPYAILLIDTPDLSLITQRLKQRDKVIASHQNADAETLANETKKWRQLLHTAVADLEQKGVQVYHLDASQPVRKNVALARQFLDNLK